MSNEKVKCAFVSGGSRGIGREIVTKLVAAGYCVTFTYKTSVSEAREVHELHGDAILPIQCDVADRDSIGNAIDQHIQHFGRLDLLINNAGINRDCAFKKMSWEDWTVVVDTNLSSVFNHCQRAMEYLLESEGSIVNIASVSGVIGVPGQVNYAASKSGITGLTRALAKEYASRGVNINVLAPGFIKTDMTDKMPEITRERIIETIPMDRFGSVSEIANIAVFLGSKSCKYMTGQVIPVDGGLST
ncbi:3-oxoacyl-ACP reductase FabG [Agarilytica rhodophyticola]|uniref:3-oxoacyl-ACP reductase FabG n=1 Tax=Agarilytica rhodophyticola TaxID=1737490 RepID=UPI001319B924|nr:3-oxoacyl-ACP reductase FabG [Agarilytica rhodophyticola]